MADKTWKAVERRVAEMFGTDRTPLSGGSSRHTRSDTLHPRLYIEIKHRARNPWITLFREEVEPLAAKEGKVPLVILSEKGRHDFFLFCRLREEDIVKIAEEMCPASMSTVTTDPKSE